MTDITSTLPVTVREFRFPRLRWPRFRFRTNAGYLVRTYGEAYSAAVMGFSGRPSRHPDDFILDPACDGRDPRW
jgi:hypothetical protein